ncbi:MAG: isopentenyl-diphosphate Delta-isomerase [Candidatus Poribacteria bacterium]|nr:isopentenyl-diphosphate Delta-isomerase [Candidatus Poribacteria bacterium]
MSAPISWRNRVEEHVILVNDKGQEIGIGEKIRTHREGKLHRAFSIFVFNSQGQLLLHKRAPSKYHSGGLWTNTCCSHPRPGESHDQAVHRRLEEEMGFDCDLQEAFSFTYHAKLDNNLFEHEYDHVFIGCYDGDPVPNPAEVEDWKWIGAEKLKQELHMNPDHYTHWFKIAVDRVIENYEGYFV